MTPYLLQSINSQYPFLLQQLESLDDSFIKKRHIRGKWSIQEHLAHLGRYHEIFLERIGVILEEEAPQLVRYKADNDDGFYEWCRLSTAEIITNTQKKRVEIIQILKHLTEEQIKRIGIHPKLGKLTIEDWASFFMLHEAHHIYAVFGLKQRFNQP